MLHLLRLPTPFPVGPVNVYLAEGDPLTLIDTGPKDDATRQALEAGLARLGYRVEDLRRVILTHHHADHVGLAAEIARRSGAEILAHPYSQPWLRDYPGQRELHRPFFEHIWQAGGVPADIIQAIDQAAGAMARWMEPVADMRAADEGDRLSLDGRTWQVFHTPGHAGGLICLWQADTRSLLANDHLLRDISSNPVLEPPLRPEDPRPRRLVEYLGQMQRMADLHPRETFPGHGEPVADVAGLVRQRRAFHQRRARKLEAVLAARPLSLWEVTQPIFPQLKRGMDFFLALSEMLAHLDLLEVEGRARAVDAGGRLCWQVVGPPREPPEAPGT